MKTRLQNRSRLPKVLPERSGEHVAAFLLGIGALMMVGVGILAGNPMIAGSGTMMAGLLVVSRLVVDLRSGVTSSNWGTWRRDENQFAYYRNICFWGAIALAWFLFGVLVMLGWIPMPSA